MGISWDKSAQRVVAVLAAAHIAVYVCVALLRIGHPFALEFHEESSTDYVAQLLGPGPLYARPTLDFIPGNYTPLYYYVTAAIASVAGNDFVPLRLLSFLSSLGCFAVIYMYGARETGRRMYGLVAAGLYAATYKACGAWFDIGRPDSFFLVLTLAACYVARFHATMAGMIAASVLIALAFLSKQTPGLIFPWIFLHLLLFRRRQCFVMAVACAVLIGGACVALDAVYGGWFRYYAFKVAGLHPFVPERAATYMTQELLPATFVAFCLWPFLLWRDRARGDLDRAVYYLLFGLAMLVSSWMVRSHEGAYLNVSMPACAALAILFALALHSLHEWLDGLPREAAGAARPWVWTLALVQMLLPVYNPGSVVPTRADREAGEAFVRLVAEMPGEVYVPNHGHLARRAGKRSHANAVNIGDVLADPAQLQPGGLLEEIVRALEKGRFSVIVYDAKPGGEIVSKAGTIDRYYREEGRLRLGPDPAAFRPLTGTPARPEVIYVPRRTAATGTTGTSE